MLELFNCVVFRIGNAYRPCHVFKYGTLFSKIIDFFNKNNKECNPEKSNIRVVRYEDEGVLYSIPVVCQQCEKALCQQVCPTSAIFRNPETNALVIDRDKCIGCRYCATACPFGAIAFDPQMGTARKCTLCEDEPQCVAFCPKDALLFIQSDKVAIWKNREGVNRYLDSLKNILYPSIDYGEENK